MNGRVRRVKLRLGSLCFSAGLLPTLATFLLLPVLIGLGFWQLERAEMKHALQLNYEHQLNGPPLRMYSVLEDVKSIIYRRVRARGRYEVEHQILHDNRVHQRQAGYHVLTPFRIEGGSVRVLVNRGWVPSGRDRREVPSLPAPDGVQEITAIAAPPPAIGMRLGTADRQTGSGWTLLWQNIDLDRIAAQMKQPLQPVVLLLDPEVRDGGYTRTWPPLDAGAATSQSYAFQWFSMAIALTAIYILVNTRRCEDDDADQTR